MAIITEPMALDKSFNTTETTPRSQADVLAGIEQAILQGMGRQANEVAYDNTTSGLSANDVQEAIDELADEKVDKVNGKGLSTNDYTDEEKSKLAGIEQGAEVNVQADWAQTDSNADDYIKNKQLVTEPIEELQNEVESTQTVSGNPLTLTDCAPINAESLVVELEPKQDLHGQSAPYVGGVGKNKLPMTVDGLKEINDTSRYGGVWTGNSYAIDGITFTIETDGDNNVTGIKANGTATANTDFLLRDGDLSAFAGLILNGCPTGGGTSSYYIMFQKQSTPWETYARDVGTDTQIESNIATSRSLIWIRVMQGYNANNIIFRPMISADGGAFAPYENKCSITGYTECSVDDVGHNQWDEEWVIGKLLADGSVDSDTTRRTTGFILVRQNETYYQKSPQNAYWGRYAFYDKDKNCIYINPDGFAYYFTAPENAKYVRITFNVAYGTTYNHDISINYPSTFTEYEPYQSTSATIQFGQTVYGADVDFSGGTDDEWAKYDTWDTSWYKSSTEATILSKSFSDKKSGVNEIKCNAYKYEANQGFNLSYGAISNSGVADYRHVVFIRDSRFAGKTVAECVAILNDEGTYFVYQLETPNELSTPATPLKLLKGTNNLTTNGTTINLGYQPDNVIGEVKGEIEQHLEMPYLRILDNDVDTDIKNYQLYYKLIASAYTLVNLAEMLQHRFLFVEVVQNPSGTSNDKLLHSVLIDPRTIDGFEYQMKAGTGDTVCIKTNIAENKLDLYVQSTGTHTSGDPTDYYVTIRMVD